MSLTGSPASSMVSRLGKLDNTQTYLPYSAEKSVPAFMICQLAVGENGNVSQPVTAPKPGPTITSVAGLSSTIAGSRVFCASE